MWCLNTLERLNNREVERIKNKPVWPRYGVTGDEKMGLHIRCEQRLLTFFVEPGEPARRFLERLSRLEGESQRDNFIASHFPFPT